VRIAIAEGVSAAILRGAFGGVRDAFAIVVRTVNVSAVASRRLTVTATTVLADVSCGMASELALNALVADASARAAILGSSLTSLLRGSVIAPELVLTTAVLIVSSGTFSVDESSSADLLRAQTVIAATSSTTGILALALAVIAGRYIFLRRRAALNAASLTTAVLTSTTDSLAASINPLWDKAGARAIDLAISTSTSMSAVDIALPGADTRAGHGAALRSRRTWHSAEASDTPRDVHPTRVAVEALARPPSGDRRVFTPERLNGLRFEALRGFRSPAAIPRTRDSASTRLSRDNLEPTLESALGHLEGEDVGCKL